MATVFLDGQFIDTAGARVSAFDAGFQHGVGLFETMLGGTTSRGGPWVLRLEEHVERLGESARSLGLSDSLRISALADAVLETVLRSGEPRCRVRLTVTGGDLNMLARSFGGGGVSGGRAAPEVQPTILIVAQPATRYPREMFERGVAVTTADYKVNPLDPLAGHKTLNYWPRLRELQVAAAKRAAEALVFQVTNHLAGGCVSNALVVKGGRIVTPIARGEEEVGGPARGAGETAPQGSQGIAMPSPVLPGITREWALEWANQNRVPVERRMIGIDQVLAADEILLTNSSWGVLPVIAVEAGAIGTGKVGVIGSGLVEAWEAQIAALAGE